MAVVIVIGLIATTAVVMVEIVEHVKTGDEDVPNSNAKAPAT